jgi:hypothetical protein
MSTTAFLVSYHLLSENEETKPFYVGVTFCGNTTVEAKLLIDRVKTYTNLFVLQSGPISKNETATNEICDYAVATGLRIIVYFGWFDPDCPWQIPWLDLAKQRWGDRFLGVYYYDEPGGTTLDYNWARIFNHIKEVNLTLYQIHAPAIERNVNGSLLQIYDEAAKMYINAIETDSGLKALKTRSIMAFTSDYALYWFDYLGGYDVMLAQLGWNDSLVQHIALIRGAARMQNKTWGAIITWKYEAPPYLDSGEEIYKQMRMAYEAGATYVMIFNYPKINDNPYGVMCDEHFEALERFWNEVTAMPKKIQGSVKAEAALVLPRSYGWGMRHPEDRIWGFWGPDEQCPQIWELSRNLLAQYGLRLDIVYDDPAFPVILRRLPIWLTTAKYPRIYYCNHSM